MRGLHGVHVSIVRLWRINFLESEDGPLIDSCGRTISYLRISVTDRCNLRCSYCMPPGTADFLPEEQLLRAEELLRVCALATRLGITDFRLTGGEPLLRPDLACIARGIASLDGVRRLAITTNGVYLAEQAKQLRESGVQAVNISLDSLCPQRYRAITGFDRLAAVRQGIDAALGAGLAVKLNCVCLPDVAEDAIRLVRLAKQLPVCVRFIELMPIGQGQGAARANFTALKQRIYAQFGTFSRCESSGSGPAAEETRSDFAGSVGWIAACSAPFCASCNRVRLTSAGILRPCLGHDGGADLKQLLRGGADDETLLARMKQTIYDKPVSGGFDAVSDAHMNMHCIGG